MAVRHAVIITAAGSSDRFNSKSAGGTTKKEFLLIDGKPVLLMAAAPFFDIEGLCAAVFTYKEGYPEQTKAAVKELTDNCNIPVFFVKGGNTRQESVFNALKELYSHTGLGIEVVSIHDGARPFLNRETVVSCISGAKRFGGAVPGTAVSDTLVRADKDGFVAGYIERDGAYGIQTPQCFLFPDIFFAHLDAVKHGRTGYTDDTRVFIDYGGKVSLVPGQTANRKITFPEDVGNF